MEIEYIPARTVMKELRISLPTLKRAIINGTLPIGFVSESGKSVVKIYKTKWDKHLKEVKGEL